MLNKIYNRVVNSDSYALCNNLGNHIHNFMRGILNVTDYNNYTYFMDLVLTIHQQCDVTLATVNVDGFTYTLSVNSILKYLNNQDAHPYEYAKPYYHCPEGMITNTGNTHLLSVTATQQYLPVSRETQSTLSTVYDFLFNYYCNDLTWGMFLESLYETCCDIPYNLFDCYSNLRSAVMEGYKVCNVY